MLYIVNGFVLSHFLMTFDLTSKGHRAINFQLLYLLKVNSMPQNRSGINEPQHDKTNIMSVRPAKTQISLGIRPGRSDSALSALGKLGSLATH